jgi:hypothetical protein
MKKHILLIVLSGVSFVSKAQDYTHILDDSLKVTKNSVSTDDMTDRIKKDAADYAKYAPVPRLAEIDFAFGANAGEYKKLKGCGVLYIPSLNRDSLEYPIKRVYIKTKDKIFELEKLGQVVVAVQDKQIIDTFGKNRVDFYYLIPYQLTQTNGELLIDWSRNRTEFLLSKFPNGYKLDYLTEKNISKNQSTIDKQFLKTFLLREFNITVN